MSASNDEGAELDHMRQTQVDLLSRVGEVKVELKRFSRGVQSV